MMPDSQPFYSLGVTGYPLGHSLSPRLHQAALRSCGLAGEYRLYPIPPLPEGQASLEALIDELRAGRLDGLNVTIPHKQKVIPYLDEMTPLAEQIGAVNTLYRRGQTLIGDNTDAPGFMADVQKQLPLAANPQAALVLGGGGSARAVVYALLTAGWFVTMAARRPEAAQEIQDSFTFSHPACDIIPLDALPEYVLSLDQGQRESPHPATSFPGFEPRPLTLIVNTTPVGMLPDTGRSPWPAELPFPSQASIYDLVYNPVETQLVRSARSAGLQAANGLGMLIEQAALAFERWTGMGLSLAAMQQAGMEHFLVSYRKLGE
jgi:shikimate dehydrogenase